MNLHYSIDFHWAFRSKIPFQPDFFPTKNVLHSGISAALSKDHELEIKIKRYQKNSNDDIKADIHLTTA